MDEGDFSVGWRKPAHYPLDRGALPHAPGDAECIGGVIDPEHLLFTGALFHS
jgi:hypothetical protein